MDDKNKTERLDFSRLNETAKKAIANVSEAAVKAGKAIAAATVITNVNFNKIKESKK